MQGLNWAGPGCWQDGNILFLGLLGVKKLMKTQYFCQTEEIKNEDLS